MAPPGAVLPLNYNVVAVFYFDQPEHSWFTSKYVLTLFQ